MSSDEEPRNRRWEGSLPARCAGWGLLVLGNLFVLLGCQSEKTVTFGLGERDRVDTLRVHWPSSTVDERTEVDANQELRLKESVRRP